MHKLAQRQNGTQLQPSKLLLLVSCTLEHGGPRFCDKVLANVHRNQENDQWPEFETAESTTVTGLKLLRSLRKSQDKT